MDILKLFLVQLNLHDDEVWQFKDKSSILIVDRLIVSFEITIKILLLP